jgi:hypothetical protein
MRTADDRVTKLLDKLDAADGLDASRGVFPIAVQIWAEAQRDPALHASAITLFGTVQTRVTRVLTGFQEHGVIDTTVDVAALTMAIIGLVQGYITSGHCASLSTGSSTAGERTPCCDPASDSQGATKPGHRRSCLPW